MDKKKRIMIAASVAGLVAASSLWGGAAKVSAADVEPCYGINACKGVGDCGGKGHSCAGKNACKGMGYLDLPKGTCMKIQGGSLTPQS